MNSITILGCGNSGAEWDGEGMSIGVNDCWKFGRPTTYLLCVQTIQQMTSPRQPKERLQTIINSTPMKFVTHKQEWERYFKPEQMWYIGLSKWNNKLRGLVKDKKGVMQLRFSHTSPFIAINMAYSLGYDHIKIYGADYTNHPYYSPGKVEFSKEMAAFKQLFSQLKQVGVKIECTKESYLNNFL